MDANEPQLAWLASILDLTADNIDTLVAAASADPTFLATASNAAQQLARRLPAGSLPAVVRRPLTQLNDKTLLELLLTDPARAQALVTSAFDWSRSA